LLESDSLTTPYVVLVPAAEPALFRYLSLRFRDDPGVSVVLQTDAAAPRVRARSASSVCGVVVGRHDPSTPQSTAVAVIDEEGPQRMDNVEMMVEDRQRVDRWLEESQYLLARIIPGYLDDRERLKGRLAAAEAEADRLRQDLEEARRDIAALRSELGVYRSQHDAAADALSAVMAHLSDLQRPLAEAQRHLQSTPMSLANGVHA
jgi:hypothetical protein